MLIPNRVIDQLTIAVSLTLQVLNAQECGAAGVILYGDPAEYTHHSKQLYPETQWLPGWAVQRGTVSPVTGDLLTPHLPAIGTVFKQTDQNKLFEDIWNNCASSKGISFVSAVFSFLL